MRITKLTSLTTVYVHSNVNRNWVSPKITACFQTTRRMHYFVWILAKSATKLFLKKNVLANLSINFQRLFADVQGPWNMIPKHAAWPAAAHRAAPCRLLQPSSSWERNTTRTHSCWRQRRRWPPRWASVQSPSRCFCLGCVRVGHGCGPIFITYTIFSVYSLVCVCQSEFGDVWQPGFLSSWATCLTKLHKAYFSNRFFAPAKTRSLGATSCNMARSVNISAMLRHLLTMRIADAESFKHITMR